VRNFGYRGISEYWAFRFLWDSGYRSIRGFGMSGFLGSVGRTSSRWGSLWHCRTVRGLHSPPSCRGLGPALIRAGCFPWLVHITVSG
jgi:hypothetical protein